MINFILVQNKQGRTRLAKWYIRCPDEEKHRVQTEVHRVVATRDPSFTRFLEFSFNDHTTYKLIYRQYAQLYFIFCVDIDDNELSYFEAIHLFVETLDEYFHSVCELDLVYSFGKVYRIIDDFVLAGELQEPSIKKVIKRVEDDEKASDS